MRSLALGLAFLVGFLPTLVFGQASTASLFADSIGIDGESRIIAEGDVQIFFEDSTLNAARLIYDRAGDRLQIEGPILLVQGERTVILASDAELSGDLRTGILRSARLVLDQQLQIASAEINNVDERYTVLTRSVASTCKVCADNLTPIWEIRADRVIRDALERQIYFDNAQIRFGGVPIFWVPRLRLPDPSLSRATGFLFPEVRTLSDIGAGVRIPYFFQIGERADLTIAPYIATNATTLEARYRQTFRRGRLSFESAISNDSISDEGTRAYLFGEGEFLLPAQYLLTFDAELISDRTYLLEYDYSEKDRLDSELAIGRVRNDETILASVTSFRTLREDDQPIADQLPFGQIRLDFSRRIPTGPLGGEAWIRAQSLSVARESNTPILGRDMTRSGISLDWRRDWTLGPGVIVEAQAGLQTDIYSIEQDPTFADVDIRQTKRAALSFRWPHARNENGARSVLEPVVQIAWAETNGVAVPNEDSTLVELDEGNLFSFSRFPGEDGVETGLRLNLGATYWTFFEDGRRMGFALGRVIRSDDISLFSEGTGLDGAQSDWLASVHLDLGNGLSVASRGLFDNAFEFSRNETRLAWMAPRGALGATYVYAIEDPANGRDDALAELGFDGRYDFSDRWSGFADSRYDFVAQQLQSAGLGLTFETDCISMAFTVSRRFTEASGVEPLTDFGIIVSLGANQGRSSKRSEGRKCTY